ncbi:PTS glucose transporter subunit IIA [Kocuria sp. TGY1127_2]|uniref:PTS sugar transporter subunit IIA n=1 Tax=Kocuria sp. TGY1127_2 TaxID=2711328 RepID=UPI0015B8C3E0|nr:PTS glucose transporter subunit IIA [Kocuria sp. TGY1127_2]
MSADQPQPQDAAPTSEHPSQILAPVAGEIIRIEHVDDPVFAGKMMGEGFGIQNPTSGEIVAPVAGEVTVTTSSKHALGIRTDDGLEVLLHLGIDTVELKGAPFELHSAKHDRVAAGQRLGTMDIEAVRAAGKDPTSIVVITNSADRLEALSVQGGQAALGDVAASAVLRD